MFITERYEDWESILKNINRMARLLVIAELLQEAVGEARGDAAEAGARMDYEQECGLKATPKKVAPRGADQ
jgi:hypothetical protein